MTQNAVKKKGRTGMAQHLTRDGVLLHVSFITSYKNIVLPLMWCYALSLIPLLSICHVEGGTENEKENIMLRK